MSDLGDDYKYAYRDKRHFLFSFLNITTEESTTDQILKKEDVYRKDFKVSKVSGTLPRNKPYNVNIVFNPSKAIDFCRLPIYNVVFLDSNSKEAIESFTLTASAKAYTARYRIKQKI